jgi:hypothetical protein
MFFTRFRGHPSRAETLRARMLASAAISMFMTVVVAWVESGRRGHPLGLFKPGLDYFRTGFVLRK